MLLAWFAGALPAAQAQTIYTWTDARGTVHYTDDPSTVPANVKATTTEGVELSNTGAPAPKVEAPAQKGAPAPVAQPAEPKTDEDYWRGQFRAVREKIRSLEDELAVDQRRFDDPSRTPGGPNYVCPPAYYYPGYVSRPIGGFGSSQVVQGGISASASIPLGNGATLGINGAAGSAVTQGSSTVVGSGVTPFVGYPGYGYAPYGGCFFSPSDDYLRMRDRIERSKSALARAKEELADLERRAANAAVPLEWRH